MRLNVTHHLKPAIAAGLAIAMVGALAACQPRQREREIDPWTAEAVELNVRTSHREVLAGEIVTLTAETRNTFGRDVRVEWDATGGDLETEQEGRIARVHFDRAGRYLVTGRLFLDDELHQTDTTEITVRPVNGQRHQPRQQQQQQRQQW